jgi:DNA-binding LacI/PurR family transcriptional regulator
LLKRGTKFDAIFAASDVAAIGAMHALQNHGLTIPADVAVVGFDDIPAASLSTPRLTTVAQDPHRAAEMLIDTLVDGIEAGGIHDTQLPVHLTVRESSAGNAPA